MNREEIAREMLAMARELMVAPSFSPGDYIMQPHDESPIYGRVIEEQKNGGYKAAIDKKFPRTARKLEAAKMPSEIVEAVEASSSFMDVGKELKKRGVKYEFSTKVFPIYTIRRGGKMIVVINKKYVDGADVIVGDIAIGEM